MSDIGALEKAATWIYPTWQYFSYSISDFQL